MEIFEAVQGWAPLAPPLSLIALIFHNHPISLSTVLNKFSFNISFISLSLHTHYFKSFLTKKPKPKTVSAPAWEGKKDYYLEYLECNEARKTTNTLIPYFL